LSARHWIEKIRSAKNDNGRCWGAQEDVAGGLLLAWKLAQRLVPWLARLERSVALVKSRFMTCEGYPLSVLISCVSGPLRQ